MCLVHGNRMEIRNKRHYNPCTNTFELSGFLCFSVLGNSEWIVGKLKKWNGFLKPKSRAVVSGCGVAVHRMLLSFMSWSNVLPSTAKSWLSKKQRSPPDCNRSTSSEVRSNDEWGKRPSYIATQGNPFVLVGTTENGGRIDVLSHDGLLLCSVAEPALLKNLAVQLSQPLGGRLRSIN